MPARLSASTVAVAALSAACVVRGSYLEGRISSLSAAHDATLEHAAARQLSSEQSQDHTDGVTAEATALVETGVRTEAGTEAEAGWRFSTNYVPQHYGNWKFEKGKWNFGADDRIQCESCGYCLYFAVDQLGDNFDAEKVSKVLTDMVSEVQWVFKSACQHIVSKSKKVIVSNMMKLVEPQETCRAAGYCSADPFDVMVQKGGRTIQGASGASSGYAPTMTINPVDPPGAGLLGSGAFCLPAASSASLSLP